MRYTNKNLKQHVLFDEKFLSKEIFIADGPDAGFTTLLSLIGEIGPSLFSIRYAQGGVTWDYDYRTGRWTPAEYDPYVIVFAESLSVVNPTGALGVFRRHQKDMDKVRYFYVPGYKPSAYRRCRRPKVVGLMREACLVMSEDGEIPHHPKILAMDTYGVRRSCYFDRNWKRFRKMQYKDGA